MLSENGDGLPPMFAPGPGMYPGVPYRGPQMNIRDSDPEHRQPQLVHDPKIRVFDMADKKDVEDYLGVIRKIAAGEFALSYEEVKFVDSSANWKILLRWHEMHLTAPKSGDEHAQW